MKKYIRGLLFTSLLVPLAFVVIGAEKVDAQSTDWVQNSGNIYFEGGNVGINNSNPQYSLDIGNRITRLQGDMPAFIMKDTHVNGKQWGFFSGSPDRGDFKIRDFDDWADRIVINGDTGYLDSNTRLLSVNGSQPVLILNDNRTSGGDYAMYSGSPNVGDFKIRNNNNGSDKFIIYGSGSMCIGHCP